jgi:hypothetical protein
MEIKNKFRPDPQNRLMDQVRKRKEKKGQKEVKPILDSL